MSEVKIDPRDTEARELEASMKRPERMGPTILASWPKYTAAKRVVPSSV